MTYRPDELANLSEIERDKKTRSRIQRGVGTAATLAASFGYGKLAQKVLPYLSNAIPLNVAMNGLEKLSPEIAGFLKKGQKMGLDINEGMEFVKDILREKTSSEEKKEPSSIFEQLLEGFSVDQLDPQSQKLLGFYKAIADKLESKGKNIKDPAFTRLKKKIKKLFKGKPAFLDVEMSRDMGQNQMDVSQGVSEVQPQQPQEGMQNPGMGPGQRALMDILQKIQSRRGM